MWGEYAGPGLFAPSVGGTINQTTGRLKGGTSLLPGVDIGSPYTVRGKTAGSCRDSDGAFPTSQYGTNGSACVSVRPAPAGAPDRPKRRWHSAVGAGVLRKDGTGRVVGVTISGDHAFILCLPVSDLGPILAKKYRCWKVHPDAPLRYK